MCIRDSSNSAFRGNFAKTIARNLQNVSNRRHRNFDSELYGFERVMKMIQCKKSLLIGLIFYGKFLGVFGIHRLITIIILFTNLTKPYSSEPKL